MSHTLTNAPIAISVSDAPDRQRLGFPQREIDRAIISICTALIRSGARVVYGGDLRTEGFTFKIFKHLSGLYTNGQTPFVHVLHEPVLRRTPIATLLEMLRERQSTATTLACIDGTLVKLSLRGGAVVGLRDGRVIDIDDIAGSNIAVALDPSSEASMHTQARQATADYAKARIALGGKMGLLGMPSDQYASVMPGVVEEAILTLERNRPLLVFGAYGGASRDMAIALGLMPAESRVPRDRQAHGYDEAIASLRRLRARMGSGSARGLEALAASDQSEHAANLAVRLLVEWLGPSSEPDRPRLFGD